jgi:hypothetical protein
MSDFNYQDYLKNNPLLKKEEVKEQLLIESQEVATESEEVTEKSMNENIDRYLASAINDTIYNHASTAGLTDERAAEEIMEYIGQEFGIDFEFGAGPSRVEEEEEEEIELNSDEDFKREQRNQLAARNEEIEESLEEEEIELSQDEMDELHKDGEVKKGDDTISYKMKVSELKAKIKEDIIALLAEQDEEEVEVEDEVELEADPEDLPDLDAADSQEGLTADEKEIQDSLKVAYDNAVAIGDTKLADQIGNSITFFTRTHVVER